MRKIVFISIFLILISGCRKVQKDANAEHSSGMRHVKVMKKDILNKPVSHFIEVDSIITLELNDISMIGEVDKVIITEKRIYIMDRSISKALFCFDKKGNFINRYQRLGKGPTEYNYINWFDADEDNVYLSTDESKFFQLDVDLNFKKRINIKWPKGFFIGRRVHILNQNTILFTGFESEYNFNFYNLKKKRFVSKLEKVTPPFSGVDVSRYSYNQKDCLIATKEFSDTIFNLSSEKMIPYMVIEYEDPIIKETAQRLDTIYPFDRIYPLKMYDIRNFFETKDYIHFTFYYEDRRHLFFQNKKTERCKILRNNVPNDVFGRKYFPSIKGKYGNSMIVPVEAMDLIENKDKISVKVPPGLTPNSNPALVFFHPKF